MTEREPQPNVYENYWEQRKQRLDGFANKAQEIADWWRKEADRVVCHAVLYSI